MSKTHLPRSPTAAMATLSGSRPPETSTATRATTCVSLLAHVRVTDPDYSGMLHTTDLSRTPLKFARLEPRQNVVLEA